MKTNYKLIGSLSLLFMLVPVALWANEVDTNRLTFSARFGFNISATFKGLSGLPTGGGQPRLTPNGAQYNYDDGYVLTDVSGNAGGQTWNWGYDRSQDEGTSLPSQIVGDTIALSRSVFTGNTASSTADGPSFGAEVAYDRLLLDKGKWRVGFEVAGNYQGLSLSENGSAQAGLSRVTDAYAFEPGTTPPSATTTSPYQGTFDGPGFLLGDIPVSSTTVVVPGGATVLGRRNYDADCWGLRFGPYIEFPLNETMLISAGGGLALQGVFSSASWSETVVINGVGTFDYSGQADDSGLLVGGYVAANFVWKLDESWRFALGVQYQKTGDFNTTVGMREVSLDMSNVIYATAGFSFSY